MQILEINTEHPIIVGLSDMRSKDSELAEQVTTNPTPSLISLRIVLAMSSLAWLDYCSCL